MLRRTKNRWNESRLLIKTSTGIDIVISDIWYIEIEEGFIDVLYGALVRRRIRLSDVLEIHYFANGKKIL